MGQEHIAGAIVLDSLRNRVISGLYLGLWTPGDRLPSIRNIAETENVDRKTAAAAYRRLQEEGLVQVRPRSGVYLSRSERLEPPGPMERLHRRWLKHTYTGARELGLDTTAILKMVGTVAELERIRIPVIECNWAQAEAIAQELRDRLGIHAVPYLLDDIRPDEPLLTEAPVLVSTPYHRADLQLLKAPDRIVIEVTSAPVLLNTLRRHLSATRLVVLTANGRLARKVRRALEHAGLLTEDGQHQVLPLEEVTNLTESLRSASHVVLWPGTPPSVEDAIPIHVKRLRPRRSVAEDAILRIRTAILDAAVHRVNISQSREEVRAL